MKLRNVFKALTLFSALALAGCGSKNVETANTAASSAEAVTTAAQTGGDKTTINVFAAASLKGAMDEIIAEYNKANPDVTISLNTDSSGKLQTQIEEGFACDIFFSAGKTSILHK